MKRILAKSALIPAVIAMIAAFTFSNDEGKVHVK
jgi:hypothetical protein